MPDLDSVQTGAAQSRTALVTGAASGIGRATVLALLADGLVVAALDRDESGLAELEKRALAGASLSTHLADLRDRPAVPEAVDDVVTRHGRLDILVNNAGIGVPASVSETTDDDWDTILEVNLTAMFRLTRAALPHLLANGAGVVVNLSSVAGVVGVPRRAAYCASKAGVLGLTRALAVDHAHEGLRANAVCPGTVATEWIDKILADAPDPATARSQMELRQLDGRMGAPEEVAATVAFLTRAEARFANGAAWVLDGGMTAQ